MSILSQVIQNIFEATNYQAEFKDFEDKQYFVVNSVMTSVYLNHAMFRHLEAVGSHILEEQHSRVINDISKVYIEALQPYLEEK